MPPVMRTPTCNSRRRKNGFDLQVCARALTFVLLISAVSSANADTLKVGSVFPKVDFLYADSTGEKRLASLPEVQEQKAIVFVFASW